MTSQQSIEPHVGNEFDIGCTAIAESGYECEQIRSLAPAELDPVDLHLIACSSLECTNGSGAGTGLNVATNLRTILSPPSNPFN